MAKIKERFVGKLYSILIIPETRRELELIQKMSERGIGSYGFSSDNAIGQNKGFFICFAPLKKVRCDTCGEIHTRYYHRDDELKEGPKKVVSK